MIGCTFSFSLYEETKTCEIFAFPGFEWIEQLKAVGCRTYLYNNATAIFCRSLESGILDVEAFLGQLIPGWRIKLHLFATFVYECISFRIERQVAGNSKGCYQFW